MDIKGGKILFTYRPKMVEDTKYCLNANIATAFDTKVLTCAHPSSTLRGGRSS